MKLRAILCAICVLFVLPLAANAAGFSNGVAGEELTTNCEPGGVSFNYSKAMRLVFSGERVSNYEWPEGNYIRKAKTKTGDQYLQLTAPRQDGSQDGKIPFIASNMDIFSKLWCKAK